MLHQNLPCQSIRSNELLRTKFLSASKNIALRPVGIPSIRAPADRMVGRQSGPPPKWTTTKVDHHQSGPPPKWTTTKVDHHQSGPPPKWTTTKVVHSDGGPL